MDPCYSKWGLRTSSIGITWELVRNTESQARLGSAELESTFLCIPQVFPVHVEFEKLPELQDKGSPGGVHACVPQVGMHTNLRWYESEHLLL